MSQKAKQKLGYRLAADRLHFTGHNTLKTIKFPITSRTQKQDLSLAQSIQHDYNLMYGPLNYPEYCRSNAGESYSVLDFWVDSLRAGVLWCSSFAKAETLLQNLTNRESFHQELSKKMVVNLEKELSLPKGKVNQLKVMERLQSAPRGITSIELLVKDFQKYFNFEKNVSAADSKIQQQIHQKVTSVPSTNADFYSLFFEFFASKDLYHSFSNYVSYPYTFIFNPDWHLEDHINDTPQEIVIQLYQMFEDQAPSYMGLKDNFNGFQNYFGEVLKLLISNDIEEIIKTVTSANKNCNESVLRERLLWLVKKAQKLGKNNSIKLGNTIADLRIDLGATLASWVSNFQRSSSTLVFDLTEKHFDIQSLRQMLEAAEPSDQKSELLLLADELLAISKDYKLPCSSDQLKVLKKAYKSKKIIDADVRREATMMVTKLQRKIKSENILQFKQVLAEFRYKANQYYQQHLGVAHTNNSKLSAGEEFKKKYSALMDELPELPAFIGEVKKRKFYKYNNSLENMKKGIDAVQKYLANLQQLPTDATQSTLKSLQSTIGIIATKLSNGTYQGKFAEAAVNLLSKYLDAKTLQNILGGNAYKYRFFETTYDRNNKQPVTYKWMCEEKEAHQELLNIHLQLLSVCKISLTKYYLKQEERIDVDSLRGAIETWKTATAFYCKVCSENELEISVADFTFSESALAYLERQTKEKIVLLTPQRFNFLMQIGVFAELKGLLSLLSLQKTISRYVVQTVNGGQQELLYLPVNSTQKKIMFSPPPAELSQVIQQYVGNHTKYLDYLKVLKSNDVNKYLFYYPHEYALNIKNHTLKGSDSAVALKKRKEKQINFSNKLDKNTLFYIHSSRYQTQFLEWFLHTPKTKQVDLDIAGGSLICEVPVKHRILQDTDGNLYISFEELKSKQKLYSSIPFDVNTKQVIKNESAYVFKNERTLKNSKTKVQYELPHRFVGVDLGEYGLAYSVVEIPETSYQKLVKNSFTIESNNESYCSENIPLVSVLDTGFIYEPGLEKIRQGVSDHKRKQVLATFTTQETYLARLRENVSKSLRNKIHSIALKYGAKIVYEGSVSGFEAGGQRISKLYKTIKTPDVMGDARNKADEMAMANIWGNDSLKIAAEIQAADTSQLSLKHRSSYKEFIQVDEKYKISVSEKTKNLNDDEVVVMRVTVEGNKKLYIPVTEKEFQIHEKNGYVTGRRLFTLCKDALRPSLKGVTVAEAKVLKEDYSNLWNQKRRGNSYLYRDLFELNAFADADMQAATNIALRGLVKECIYTNKYPNDKFKSNDRDLLWTILKRETADFYKSVRLS